MPTHTLEQYANAQTGCLGQLACDVCRCRREGDMVDIERDDWLPMLRNLCLSLNSSAKRVLWARTLAIRWLRCPQAPKPVWVRPVLLMHAIRSGVIALDFAELSIRTAATAEKQQHWRAVVRTSAALWERAAQDVRLARVSLRASLFNPAIGTPAAVSEEAELSELLADLEADVLFDMVEELDCWGGGEAGSEAEAEGECEAEREEG